MIAVSLSEASTFPARPFLEFMDQEVGEMCGLGKTKQEQEHIKMILRAMGNAGVLPSRDFPEKCYMVSGEGSGARKNSGRG